MAEDPPVIVKILSHLGLPSRAPLRAPARRVDEEVLANHLAAFNAEAAKRFPKWTSAKNADDLSTMKEAHFLQILHAISVIGKNTKDELEGCLKLRNTCGHPNSHKIGEHRVASHIETLMLNVFSQFRI